MRADFSHKESARNDGGGYHPRGDRKSAETIENRVNRGFPLRKRVRNCMKMRDLHVCDKQQRTWQTGVGEGGGLGYPTPGILQKEAVSY
jgi:hypothetical protein